MSAQRTQMLQATRQINVQLVPEAEHFLPNFGRRGSPVGLLGPNISTNSFFKKFVNLKHNF